MGPGRPVDPTAPTAKGSTVRSTYSFVLDRLGADGLERVRQSIDASTRQRLDQVEATDELPYGHLVALWESIDRELGGRQPIWADSAGAYAINSVGVLLYGGILRKATPRAFLTQSISLFRLYYHPGDITVVEDGPGRAILRLIDFDPVTRLFCGRLTGGLRRAVELAGGESARVRHVRCSIEGDAFCEWQLEWHVPPG